MVKVYEHYRTIPRADWKWPNFSPVEIASPDTGEIMVDEDALNKLQALRSKLGRPLIINSAYRTEDHNKKVKGQPNSFHRQGKAFDIALVQPAGGARAQEREELIRVALSIGFNGIGRYDTFVHVDTGPRREWDERTQK